MAKKQTLKDFYNQHRIIIIILAILFGVFIVWFLISSIQTYKIHNCDLTIEVETIMNNCSTQCFASCISEGFPIEKNINPDFEEKTQGYGIHKKIICICKCNGCKKRN